MDVDSGEVDFKNEDVKIAALRKSTVMARVIQVLSTANPIEIECITP